MRAEAIRGAPKYLEGKDTMEKPKMHAISLWVEGGVLRKKIWDLTLLMRAPVAIEKLSSKALKERAS